MPIKQIITTLLVSLTLLPVYSQRKVSLSMETQTLQEGKVLRSEAEIYFKFPEGDMVLKEIFPDQNIYMSNPLGEVRLYNPKKNQLIIKANELFTSRNQNLYYFLTNQTYDLGLEGLGFKVVKSEPEDQYFVTWWQAPSPLSAQVNQIKLVHENMVPVHADYLDQKGKSVLKVYFSQYQPVSGSQVPANITEIIYLPAGDSLIKRTLYKNIKWDAAVDENRFKIVIPENAEIIR